VKVGGGGFAGSRTAAVFDLIEIVAFGVVEIVIGRRAVLRRIHPPFGDVTGQAKLRSEMKAHPRNGALT
jgi:hypothetical protein